MTRRPWTWARGRTARALAALSAVFLLALVVTAANGLPLLVGHPVSRARVLRALAVYWVVACCGTALVLELRRRAALVLVASILATLAAAEAGLRLLHPAGGALALRYLYSPRFHHALPPDARMVSKMVAENRLDVTISTNEDGFRTAYSRAGFLAKKRRIAFLGDSFTFGLGVEGAAAMPSVVERVLRERAGDDDLGVLNTGAVGYSPLLEKLVFRAVVKDYRPELVFLILDATDFGDDYNYAHVARRRDGEVTFAAQDVRLPDGLSLLSHLALYERLYFAGYQVSDLLRSPLSGGVLGKGGARPSFPLGSSDQFFIFKRPPEETRPYFEATLQHVVEIAADVRRAGAEFVLVVPPRFQLWDPGACPKNWEARSYSTHEPYTGEYLRFFDEARARVDFRIVNLLPAFRASRDTALVFHGDPHWNEKGNELVARALVDYVVAEGLLPRP